jgi:hypothetical protein
MTSNMRMKTRIIPCLALAAGVVLAGAVLPGCASRTTVTSNQNASVGKQLQDLDKAYKDGIIDQKEYERLKKALIKKND